MSILEVIEKQISENPIILYMKGTPEQPRCGFSARVAQALDKYGANFAYVDILAHPEIREHLPQYANWPTFPQLYIKGELIGGSDIIAELDEKNELQALLASVVVED